MDSSGLAYQVLGEEVRLLLADKRGEVIVEEDMSADVLIGPGQGTPFLLIRLDASNPRDSPVPSPIGPQFNYNNPLPWISLL